MKKSFRLLACVVLTMPSAAGLADDAAKLARGEALLQPFKQQLQEALQTGMAKGAVAAIDACRLRGPAIAFALSDANVQVGRSSHAWRNPANAPEPWMRTILVNYMAEAKARQPVAVELPGDRVGYVEPIIMQPLCLACHGADLAPAVAQEIGRLYPGDRATGFAPGELRGIFWATFPAQP